MISDSICKTAIFEHRPRDRIWFASNETVTRANLIERIVLGTFRFLVPVGIF